MIAVDSSAVIAIIQQESERPAFLDVLDSAQGVLMSAASLVETRMVAWSRGRQPLVDEVNALILAYGIEIVSPGAAETDVAHNANTSFGKGSGHPAGLNFGDLFSYALAKTRGVPLLFKGDDFVHTDIELATVAPPTSDAVM
jgi:ribonuclease VapC